MSESIMMDIFKKSKETKQIICVKNYGEDDSFWLGYVEDYNEDLLVLQHYTSYGKPDGKLVERMEHIFSVEFENEYCEMMTYLIQHADVLDQDDEFKLKLGDSEDWQLDLLRQIEGNKELMACIEINDDGVYYGFVVYVSDYDFILNLILNHGDDDGKVIYKLEDVTSISVNNMQSRRRKLFYNWRKSLK